MDTYEPEEEVELDEDTVAFFEEFHKHFGDLDEEQQLEIMEKLLDDETDLEEFEEGYFGDKAKEKLGERKLKKTLKKKMVKNYG